MGKSALLAAAERLAEERGVRTLRTVGIESEAHIGFAGLHQLLRPVLPYALDELPVPQRRAIKGAFGLTDELGRECGWEYLPRRLGRNRLLSYSRADGPETR